MKRNIIPIFIPHLGCPHDCVFCNQNKIASTSIANKETVKNTIDEYLDYFRKDSIVEVAFYGGSFTAIPIEDQINFLSVANEYKKKNLVSFIRLSTRPDYIDENILEILKSNGVDTVELGVQSSNQNVLNKSGRGHDFNCVKKSVNLLKEYEFYVGLQQMVGLPESNDDLEVKTALDFINLKPDFVRIYPTLVVKDTELENKYNKREYNALSLPEAVNICTDLLSLYKKNNIPVIRIGLQPTDEINYDGSVVAGPFHPAFRQLVETKILIDSIIDHLKNIEIKHLLIEASGRNISMISGQNKSGSNMLIESLNLDSLKFKQIKDIDEIILNDEDNAFKIVI